MNRNVVLGLIAVAITLAVGVAYFLGNQPNSTTQDAPIETAQITDSESSPESSPAANFTEIKSAHYVSSAPKNNEVLTTPPTEIKLNFNFTLSPNSTITISKNGSTITTPTPTISPNKLALSIPFTEKSGSYKVDYNACWPDRSCHEGSFGFIVAP